jgi:hypothetical protein
MKYENWKRVAEMKIGECLRVKTVKSFPWFGRVVLRTTKLKCERVIVILMNPMMKLAGYPCFATF